MLAAMAQHPEPLAESLAGGLEPWSPVPGPGPEPDASAEPAGYVVADGDVRIHFHDWGGPAALAADRGPAVLLLPGLLQTAWSWAPVARRLVRARRTLVADLRGQGLSDAPPDGYDLASLAGDAVAVVEAAGLDADGPDAERPRAGAAPRIVVAGHGFGAIVAAAVARRLGERCVGLVLVDGGFERLEMTTGLDVDAFLRGSDEPPEVLRSMDAWLASRRAFDPPTWDADQERAARDGVVETAAGHLVRTVRPFVVAALVRTMFGYDPAAVLPDVRSPVTALVTTASADTETRVTELARAAAARVSAGRAPIRVARFGVGHNLMRYQPAGVAAAILAASG